MQAGVGAVLLAVLAVVLLAGRPSGAEDVRDVVQAAGAWAPVMFVLLQVAVTLPPVPRTVFTLAAGVLFGSVAGIALAVVASTLTAVLAFLLVRTAARGLVLRWADHRAFRWVQARLDSRGLLAVTSLRLIAPVPFAVMNYAAGLSGVRFAPYLLGTVLGSLPGTVAVVVLGDAVTGEPRPELLAVSVLCGMVGLAGVLVAARRPEVADVAAERAPLRG